MTSTEEPARIERPPGKRKYTARKGSPRYGRPPKAARPELHPDESVSTSITIPEWMRAWGVTQPEGFSEIARQALLREYWRRTAGVGCTLTAEE